MSAENSPTLWMDKNQGNSIVCRINTSTKLSQSRKGENITQPIKREKHSQLNCLISCDNNDALHLYVKENPTD